MTRDDLPKDVSHFLDNCIDSVEQLRVLLLLFSHSDRTWSVSEITAELRSVETSILRRLNDLYDRKVLTRSTDLRDRHAFRAGSAEVEQIVRSLAEQNQLRPYRVIESIYSKPNKALLEFANAFKLRGEK